MKCARCDGCGQIANTEAGEPWTAWTGLPVGSAIAVIAGLVRPVPCPVCEGKGRQDLPSPIACVLEAAGLKIETMTVYDVAQELQRRLGTK